MLNEINAAKTKDSELEAAEDFDAAAEEYVAASKLALLQESCLDLATAQIFMMIAFGLNTCVMLMFARTKKATDVQWYRIRVYNFVCIVFQVVSGAINIIRMVSQLGLPEEEMCNTSWIGVSLALQSLFIIALIFNVISASLIRIELVNRISKYFYYIPEPEIAIKY